MTQPEIGDEYFTRREAATMFDVLPGTVVMWIRLGKLAGKKVGRDYLIPVDDLLALVESEQ